MKGLFVLLLLLASRAFAKSVDTYGAVPFISVTKGLGPRVDLNVYHKGLFNLTERSLSGKTFKARDTQAYFQTSLGYKLSPGLSLAFGYVYQRNNPFDVDFSNEHRLFQQAVLSQSLKELVLSHRFRFEERSIDSRGGHQNKTRLRYQIGANAPLEGRQLDPGEWYLNAYNEFFFSTTGERESFYSEDRVYAGAGYLTVDWGKIEVGPIAQYTVINRDKDARIFYALQVGWILKFK